MSVPGLKDITVLDNACTVIVDDTFYSYSEKGFMSLSLKGNAKWETLPGGVKLAGPSCAGKHLTDKGAASLLVVGGYSDDKSYSGLQEYTFSTNTWKNLTAQTMDMQNRRGHGVVYNDVSDTMVVFSGLKSDDPGAPAGASQETYKIKFLGDQAPQVHAANPPKSGKAGAVKPMLFPWAGADIALISGPEDGGTIWLMNADPGNTDGWRPVGSVKDSWPSDSAAIRGTLVSSTSDSSQSLLKFDLSRSPNVVTRIPLAKAPDAAMYGAAAATKRSVDFGLGNWPEYNSTNAPDTTRTGYSVAQGANGMIVMSGGNAKEPVAIFNAQKNSWVNTTDSLGDGTQKNLASSTTSTTSTTSTSLSSTFATSITTASSTSATPTATSPASTTEKNGPSSNAILGITLGTIAAFLAILLVILLLLKRRKRRMNPNQGAVLNPDEKDTVAFARSTQPPVSHANYRGHNPTLSTESYSSVAILMGRMGPQKQAGANSKTSRASSRSSMSSVHKQFKSTISKPIPQPSNNPMLQAHDDRGIAFDPTVAEPRPRNGEPNSTRDGTRRSSGWNKYWSGGSALQILGYGNKRATVTSERSSRYSESNSANNNVRATQDSATVPPLNFESPPEVNSVNTGSPVVSQYISKVPTEGMAGTIERPVSPLSSVSGYSSGVPESINEMFRHSSENRPWGHDRAPSSIYQSGREGSTAVPHSSGVSQQPQLAMAATSSDMSWLNLGDQNRK
ncbi:pre-mRNA splicing factor CLF1 [Cordyceps fumosorosea ARSEF 2679]|uniref:Pre-mRNA splicing factor CLF1 n=1 Tax=Cordyceps fumosorosea (strain ARSEF 2679) TaxID=1081104 RepID=A0A162LNE7_CORFA|nr:pre-mRNA splicing factor CLF1 [Cordyceps fumosorosea ARSEF 2679]OAA73254.1 pre-mRNA splicing factor CLF1 [Cordyceps fumosorosea ARSEF 2679]